MGEVYEIGAPPLERRLVAMLTELLHQRGRHLEAEALEPEHLYELVCEVTKTVADLTAVNVLLLDLVADAYERLASREAQDPADVLREAASARGWLEV